MNETLKLFDSVIEESPDAYTKPGAIVYQVTAEEVVEFARLLLAPEKRKSLELQRVYDESLRQIARLDLALSRKANE